MKLVCKIATAFALTVAIAGFAPAAFADDVTFNYQGRVKVQGQAFDGGGLFKFALLNTSGNSVLWSNDGTTGIGSDNDNIPVPSNAIALQVVDGVFSVGIGDKTLPGMAALDSAVLVSDSPLNLRVWFNDGVHGFEQLTPDQKLTDLTIAKIQTGLEDYHIYVDASNGNDANTGMTTETAKKTISGAVDILPDKIRCNITVVILPGVYREMVTPHGISVNYGKTLKFTGDSSWGPSSAGLPSVVIDGADTGSASVRDYCFYARQCTGVVIEGIGFQNARFAVMDLENGNYTVNRCLALGNKISGSGSGFGVGFNAGPQCYISYNDCKATENENNGFVIESSSRAFLTNCTATRNNVGVFATANSIAQFFQYNNFSNNVTGAQANALSDVSVWPNANPAQRTHIQNNTQNGVIVNWNGQFTPADAVITGNPTKYLNYYGTIIGQ